MNDPASSAEYENTFAAIPLLSLNDRGEVPPSRVKDADALRKIFTQWRNLDNDRAYNRAIVNKRLDGHPPWNANDMRNNNMDDRPNINFGGARQELELAMIPYYDRMRSTDTLVSVSTQYGEPELRDEWNQIIAEEVTRTIRAWPQFRFQTLEICKHFIWDGMGIGHFDGWIDWRWRASRLGDFYFQSQTVICEDELECTVGRWRRSPSKLYQQIKDPEVAEALGWNPDAVKKAIRKATNADQGLNWEFLEDQLKNNDLSLSIDQQDVRCIMGIWVEFNGDITVGICTEDSVDDEKSREWIYWQRNTASSMQEMLVLFPYGVGTNMKTHGMRGLGWKIYQQDLARDMLLSNALGSAERAACLMVQPNDESLMNELPLVGMGNFQLLNPGMKTIEHPPLNLEQALVPMVMQLDARIAKEMGTYAPTTKFGGAMRATKREDDERFGQSTMISSISQDGWDSPFERLVRQSVKRMRRRDYLPSEPGGRDVAELRLRLVKRGVPLEAFYQLDDERTVLAKPLGGGSAIERKAMLDQLQAIAPKFDQIGQANLTRMQVVAITRDPEMANMFVRRGGEKRVPPDVDIAILENFELLRGSDVPVRDGQLNSAHAEVHVARLEELWKEYMQGGMPIEQYANQGRALHDHAAIHVERMTGDPSVEEQAALFRQQLQQLGEDIANGMKAIAAAQRQEQEAAAAEGGQSQQQQPAQQGPTPEQEARFYEHQARMKMMREEHELKQQIKMQDAELERRLKDAKMAAEIAREQRRQGIQ